MTFSHADEASKHGAWTYEEDKLLAKYQEIHGNRWSLVAVNIPGRSGQQCAQRWRHKVNPDIRKEKWTEEEDRLLASLVAEHGNRWADIARHMPGRTDQQCMGRWRRHLDPNIRKCQWQAHEDELLKQQYESLGPQWSNISKFLQGRTAQQCRARWFQLCPVSAAPPVPRTARNQNGRRDRHHDGASIQESARQLVAQMGGTVEADDEEDGRPRTGAINHNSKISPRRGSQRGSGPGSMPEDDAEVDMRSAVAHGRAAATDEDEPDMAAAGRSSPLKSRRAAARRSDVLRQQLLSPEKGGAASPPGPRSPAKPGRAGALRSPQVATLRASKLTWEGTRTRTRATKPRKRYSPLLRSASPAALDDADCHTPRVKRSDSMKALEAEALEAAAALTEMAGGPRVHASCSPPSVRAPDQPLLHIFGAPQSPGQWVSPTKDTSCCTPAKRPASVQLWDGPSSSKHSRPGILEATPQRTPSHMHMHTPLLQHLAASPGFGASPLPVNQEPVAMTPGSRNMLRSMPLDPVDKMDLPGDFSPGLMSSQGTAATGTAACAPGPSPNVAYARAPDPGCSSAAPDPRMMQRGVQGVTTPAICGGKHGDRRTSSPRALQPSVLQGPPTRRSLVFSEEAEEDPEASGIAHALMHASAVAHSTPAHTRRDTDGILQPPSSAMSCHQVEGKVEEKYSDLKPAPESLRSGANPLFSQGGSMHRATGIDSPGVSVRFPGTPDDGSQAAHGCIERRSTGGICAAQPIDGRKSSIGAHALENDATAMQSGQRSYGDGAENNVRDAQCLAGKMHACDSPQLGAQTLSPAPQRAPGRSAAMGYSVGGVGVSLSPPGSSGAADPKGEKCESDSVFAERCTHTQQPLAEGRTKDCSVHLNINVNGKAVSNNSSTGKSSGVSSLDGLDRVANHQAGRAGSDGGNKSGGDGSGDNGQQTEDDGSFLIRQKLHSLVNDVFSFVV